ncbi:MAG: hypothetical protein CMI08_14980 [Oceanospirillaceae bacterium]|uniref:DUF2997 domain-containing protein n=1 Tax=unclassified Thalassolituus TaxID=2624967 RepID=UPI000C479D37|nr:MULTISPECIES: DUF2997 domain-containing protein [unclassified Thalassolituus]MAY00472.1 hypothetical protein [Oceanospirillaceae bacterium]MBL34506.1 hypothetical protein [Oceanospirillaceae bacterium]MBS52632.1 hypothetical protein [Oceanospirillaceae bacterium]|tara:strand:- start:168 stop:377 length:210 start_codon:yes stop_codon:yes gene_type:complete
MPEQKITLTIDDDGAITAKTSGFKGESCLEALDELLNLEGVVSNVKKTDEYHQQQTQQTNRVQSLKGKS